MSFSRAIEQADSDALQLRVKLEGLSRCRIHIKQYAEDTPSGECDADAALRRIVTEAEDIARAAGAIHAQLATLRAKRPPILLAAE